MAAQETPETGGLRERGQPGPWQLGRETKKKAATPSSKKGIQIAQVCEGKARQGGRSSEKGRRGKADGISWLTAALQP